MNADVRQVESLFPQQLIEAVVMYPLMGFASIAMGFSDTPYQTQICLMSLEIKACYARGFSWEFFDFDMGSYYKLQSIHSRVGGEPGRHYG